MEMNSNLTLPLSRSKS